MSQKYRDAASSVFFMGVGLAFCLGATAYGGIWTFPSACYFPFMGGVILIFLSALQLVWTLMGKGGEEKKIADFFPQRDSLKRLIITLSVLFLYGLCLAYLGFPITTFLFMIPLLKCLEPQRWTIVLWVAFLTSISSYLLFVVLLKVQFPVGVFGI